MQILEDNYDDYGDLTKRIKALREKVKELLDSRAVIEQEEDVVSSETNDELAQENALLRKQLADREKTIKELDFKLEMFKLAKTLREGSGIGSKTEELKQMITEYIKEIDKSITSLNIE